MKKFSNKIKLLALAAFAAIPLLSHAQQSTTLPVTTTDTTTILLPFSTLVGNLGISNIYSGWSSVVSTTNITILWSSASAAFVNTTNVTSVTNTLKSTFSAKGQSKVVLQSEYNESNNSGLGTNFWFGVAKSITGSNFDTNSLTYCTNASKGNGTTVASFTIDMTGYNYGQVILFKWDTVTAGDTLTNSFFGKSNKQTPNN